ncbi:hypothetical protein Daus18300_009539 [Diaporthe australafricana]|uniref:Uncharacterized protein n=1 Tax=Diaporthe australafricana TaxID=127596 RepID=A0ABR3WDU5_9PEZI
MPLANGGRNTRSSSHVSPEVADSSCSNDNNDDVKLIEALGAATNLATTLPVGQPQELYEGSSTSDSDGDANQNETPPFALWALDNIEHSLLAAALRAEFKLQYTSAFYDKLPSKTSKRCADTVSNFISPSPKMPELLLLLHHRPAPPQENDVDEQHKHNDGEEAKGNSEGEGTRSNRRAKKKTANEEMGVANTQSANQGYRQIMYRYKQRLRVPLNRWAVLGYKTASLLKHNDINGPEGEEVEEEEEKGEEEGEEEGEEGGKTRDKKTQLSPHQHQ